jgi:hypothetical protein
MIERRTWEEFREVGLLWWVNRVLHLFGWVIVCELEEGSEHIKDIYPAHCTFRGFTREAETEGFSKLTGYLVKDVGRMWDRMGRD